MLFQRFLQHNNMSGTALSSAMMKAYKEGLGVDFALVCQGVTKHVHSQVLSLSLSSIDITYESSMTAYLASYTVPTPHSQVIMARSPYLEAKVNRQEGAGH